MSSDTLEDDTLMAVGATHCGDNRDNHKDNTQEIEATAEVADGALVEEERRAECLEQKRHHPTHNQQHHDGEATQISRNGTTTTAPDGEATTALPMENFSDELPEVVVNPLGAGDNLGQVEETKSSNHDNPPPSPGRGLDTASVGSHGGSTVVQLYREPEDSAVLGGGYLPIIVLFIVGALGSLVATALAGVFLYEFASDTVHRTVIAQGYSQISALESRVGPEISLQDETIDEMKATIAIAINTRGSIDTYAEANDILNTSMLWNVPSRIKEHHQLAGIGMLACFPPGAHPSVAEHVYYVNMYYEPLRTGDRAYVYESMVMNTTNVSHVVPTTARQFREMIYHNTTDGSNIVIPAILTTEDDTAEEDYVKWYINQETQFNYKVKGALEPWASSFDGFPYWYMETYEYFQVAGSWYSVFTYKYMTRISELVTEVLQGSDGVKPQGSEIFVYQPLNRAIAGTSYFPESNRSENCYGSLGDFEEVGIECLYTAPEESEFPLIRDLFAQVEDKDSWQAVNKSVPTQSYRLDLDGREYFVITQLIINNAAQRIMVVWIRDSEVELAEMRQDVISVVIICCACIGGAAILTIILSYFGILQPLAVLTEDMDALANMDTERFLANISPELLTEEDKRHATSNKIEGSIFREVQVLQSHFVSMAKALHSFGLYVPRNVVKEVLLDPTKMTLTMERRDLAVMFADIAGFTTLSERFDHDKDFLGKVMAMFFRETTQIVHRHGGTIDKFIGDCVMAFWGAPLAVDEPCTRALCAGVELLQVGPEVSNTFAGRDVTMWLRIGVNYGTCLCGNTGSEERMNYTALGDTVNIASRMEGANKDYGSSFMISREVLNNLPRAENVCHRNLGYVPMRGKQLAIEGFEVFSFTKKKMRVGTHTNHRSNNSSPTKVLNINSPGLSETTSGSSGPQPPLTTANLAAATNSETRSSQSGAFTGQRSDISGTFNAEVEIAQLYKRRTGMMSAAESFKILMEASAPPERLLSACALNNLAVAAEMTDLRAAEELYNSAFQMIQAELRSSRDLAVSMSIQMKMFGLDLSASVTRIAGALSDPATNNPARPAAGTNEVQPFEELETYDDVE